MSEPGTSSTRPPALDVPGLPRFAVIDIETSGLSTRRHRILQVAVVVVEDGRIVEEWSSLARLRWYQRVGPRRVHGIDRATLRGAPPLPVVLSELARRIDGAVVTAHNVGFDWPFIHHAAARSGIALPTTPRLCTLRLSRQLDPRREQSHRLADVCARYGVGNDRPHDALHDARATALVLPYLLEQHGVGTRADLEALYDRR